MAIMSLNAALDALWGNDITKLMHRDDITEIYINDDGFVWYDSQTEGKVKSTLHLDDRQSKTIIEVVAGQIGKIAKEEQPSVSAEIPGYGCRFQGELPPIVRHPQFNIRKKAIRIFTLEDYIKSGTLTPKYAEYIKNAILTRKNILVVGGTGTGKTTFLNMLLGCIAELTPYHRIISIEDTPELQCKAQDYSPMYALLEPGKDGLPKYDATKILADCMRRSPDRIIVGEVRDGCAYAMLKAWNTGHEGGTCSVHANSAEQGLDRIESLCYENKSCAGDIRRLIGEAVDVVISIIFTSLGNGRKGRVVDDIIEVDSYDKKELRYNLRHISPE